MEGRSFLRRKDREELRERWIQRAGSAFERMFGEANQDQLVTFAERESMATALTKELAVFLMEEHIAADGQARPASKRPPCCPKCQKPGKRVTPAKEKELPERAVTTGSGSVTLQREQWRCGDCRIVFFSVRPEAEIGDGGLQSSGAAKGGTAGGQSRVVQGGQ